MSYWFKLYTWLRRLWARWLYLVGMSHQHWGNARGEQQEYETAIVYFDRALTWDPTLSRVYLDRGILFWRELDHPRRAIQELNRALSLAPTLSEAVFNRGIAYQQLREYDHAVEDFCTYLEVGEHPHWRAYAEKMVAELSEWVAEGSECASDTGSG